MRAKWGIAVITVCVLLLVFIDPGSYFVAAQEESPTLPADLLFTTTESRDQNWWEYPLNRLVRVDAETLELSTFYIDKIAVDVRALSWSPQGDKLVIHREYPPVAGQGFSRELCILDAAGTLLRCMDEAPSITQLPSKAAEDCRISWSADEQSILYVADREIDGDNRERALIEADVTTGQTLRTLYSYPYVWKMNDPTMFAWIDDLGALLVGVGEPWINRDSIGKLTALINLQTGKEFTFESLASEHQYLDTLCPDFSPQGTYFAAMLHYDLDEYNPWELDLGAQNRAYFLAIFNRNGQIQVTLGELGRGDGLQVQECPTWLSDESALFVVDWRLDMEAEAYSAFLMQYVMDTQQVVEYAPFPTTRLFSRLMPSPDNRAVAFSAALAFNVPDQAINVLLADGYILYPNKFFYGTHPIWIPISAPPGR